MCADEITKYKRQGKLKANTKQTKKTHQSDKQLNI